MSLLNVSDNESRKPVHVAVDGGFYDRDKKEVEGDQKTVQSETL